VLDLVLDALLVQEHNHNLDEQHVFDLQVLQNVVVVGERVGFGAEVHLQVASVAVPKLASLLPDDVAASGVPRVLENVLLHNEVVVPIRRAVHE